MLNFQNLYTDRPLHNEHDDVICAKKFFLEKSYKQFLGKNKIRVAISFNIFNPFSNLIF